MDRFYAWLEGLARAGKIPGVFEYAFTARGFLSILVLAPLLGGLSHVVVARRMAFFSTALGQAALTGLSIGLVLGEPINAPYGGIFGFCLLSALAMTYVKRRASLPEDTLIGVFLSLTLGLGICLLVAVTKRFNIHQVEAVMFGSLLTVTDGDLLLLLVVALGVLAVVGYHYNALMLESVEPSLARAAGVRSATVEYAFVLALTAAIVVSLKIIGALMVEALVVVPAASARNLARGARSYLALSVVTALIACSGGLWISTKYLVPSGGAAVLALSGIFFLTLLVGGIRSLVSRQRTGR